MEKFQGIFGLLNRRETEKNVVENWYQHESETVLRKYRFFSLFRFEYFFKNALVGKISTMHILNINATFIIWFQYLMMIFYISFDFNFFTMMLTIFFFGSSYLLKAVCTFWIVIEQITKRLLLCIFTCFFQVQKRYVHSHLFFFWWSYLLEAICS